MLKFLRRIFVILILLIVAFVIFRIINPTGASNLVDKIFNIPQTISDWFHRDSDDKKDDKGNTKTGSIVMTGKTNSLFGDVISSGKKINDQKSGNVNENSGSNNYDSIDDLEWLDDFAEDMKDNLGKDSENLKKEEENIKNDTTNALDEIMEDVKNKNNKTGNIITGNVVCNCNCDCGNQCENVSTGSNQTTNSTTTSSKTNSTTNSTTTKKTTKRRTNCCDANCVLSESECAELSILGGMIGN